MENEMKKTVTLILTLVIASLGLAACGNTDPAIGYWVVDHAVAGEVVMTAEDAQSIGLPAVGTVKLQKSGNCEVVLIGDEHTGTWKHNDNGDIEVKCSDGLVLTGEIDEEGTLILKDLQGSEYRLKK